MKSTAWKQIGFAYGMVYVIWSLYRSFFHMSIWWEEVVIKGAVFSMPLLVYPLKSKSAGKALGITRHRFFPGVYWGIGTGILLALAGQLGNYLRHGGLVLSDYGLEPGKVGAFLILSLVTAFWEQWLFTGYLTAKLQEYTKDEGTITLLVGFLFMLIHLPAYVLIQRMALPELVISGILLLSLGCGCVILRLRQGNLIAPIMAHALWGVTIFLFR